MMLVSRWRFRVCAMVALGASLAVGYGQTFAADPPAQDPVKIEPYTGKPIFLEEAEKVAVAPTIVTKQKLEERPN